MDHHASWRNECRRRSSRGSSVRRKWSSGCPMASRLTCGRSGASWPNCRPACPSSRARTRSSRSHASWRCSGSHPQTCSPRRRARSCSTTATTPRASSKIHGAKSGIQAASTCPTPSTAGMKISSTSYSAVSNGIPKREWLPRMHCSMNRSLKVYLNILEIISSIKMTQMLKSKIFIQLRGKHLLLAEQHYR